MSKQIGYARVSTDDQNMDLQRDALSRSGCVTIYEEADSGKSASRIELEHCLKALRSGDTLVVWRLDRLRRSLYDLVKIISELEKGSISVESLGEKSTPAAPRASCSSMCSPRWRSSSATSFVSARWPV